MRIKLSKSKPVSKTVNVSSTSTDSTSGIEANPIKKQWWNKKNLLWLEQKDGILNKTKKLTKAAKFSIVIAVLFTAYFGYKLFATTFAVIDRSGKDALALQDSISPDQLKTEGDGRVNILLIGVGGQGHEGGDLSDVNQVLSIDPFNNKASVLGIPRDFYVPIPGHYSTRINAAHAFGERANGKGPELAMQTIEQVLGVPIHYYARIDFKGFQEAVDAVGGVKVNIEEDLYDPSFPTPDMRGTKVFRLKAGTYHLDGAEALQVVRCRKGTCGSDFGRADRQQKVLTSLQKKALSLDTATNPAKVSAILNSVGSHVRTDMNLSTLMKLAKVGSRFEDKNVKPKSFVLSTEPDHFLSDSLIGGASVLVPSAGIDNFSQIQGFIRGKLFRDGFLEKENATITVLNATSSIGLADTTGERLSSYGYNVKATGNYTGESLSQTKLYKLSDKKTPFTTALLEKRLKTDLAKTKKAPKPSGKVSTDYLVIIGDDYSVQ